MKNGLEVYKHLVACATRSGVSEKDLDIVYSTVHLLTAARGLLLFGSVRCRGRCMYSFSLATVAVECAMCLVADEVIISISV